VPIDTARWEPDSGYTTRGLTAELAARGIKTDRRAVWVFLHAEGLSFKKTVLPAEQSRPDIAFKRARWLAHQRRIDPRRLVFIDETWIKTNMAPLRGWGLRGRARLRRASYACTDGIRRGCNAAFAYRTPLKPSARTSASAGIGVRPPCTMLRIGRPGARDGIARISSRLTGAAMRVASAPAS
jgi:hypothetical protein